MPKYDFRCINGHVTEYPFRMAERPNSIACPECHLQASYTILKTGSFYFDSYKNVTSDLFGIGAGHGAVLNQMHEDDKVYARKHANDKKATVKSVDDISPDVMADCLAQAGILND